MSYPLNLDTKHTDLLLGRTTDDLVKHKSEVSYSVWHLLGYLQSKVIDSKFSAGPVPVRYITPQEKEYLYKVYESLKNFAYGYHEVNDEDPIDGYCILSINLSMHQCINLLEALGVYSLESSLPTH